MSMSSWPNSFSRQTIALPINPVPPVTIIFIRNADALVRKRSLLRKIFRALHSLRTGASAFPLPTKYVGKHQRGDDRGITFNDVLRRRGFELAPGDLLVWNGPRIASVAGGRIADLAEVTPNGHVVSL